MPMAPPVACTGTPNCKNLVTDGSHTCADCRHKYQVAVYATRKAKDPNRIKFYNSAAWKRLRKLFEHRNPICQVLDHNGLQCTRQIAAVHHLVPHNGNPAIGLDWKILVALCEHHHSPLPGETENRNFAPTIGMVGDVYLHPAYLPNGKPALDRPSEPLFYTSGLSENAHPLPPQIAPKPGRPAADPKPPQLPTRTWANQ